MRVDFTAALPGLGGTCYDLAAVAGARGLYTLQSAAESGALLYVLDAGHLHGYHPSLPGYALADLGLTGEPLVLLVTAAGEQGATVNLMAPILLNPVTGAASQIILDGDYPLRAPLSAL